MRKLILSLNLIFSVLWVDAQNITGTLVDEDSKPISFANVVLLSSKDSSFVQGTITNEQGNFEMADINGDKLLKISCLGYMSIIETYTHFPVIIRMKENSEQLEEVVVKGNRPAYKLTGEGLQTNVQGTILSKAGTAEDVLMYIPGLQKKENGYEVFGKGQPVIYINGKLLRDQSELDQLKSENIKNVELITNPSAKYSAAVKAVIKITTFNVNGEGFSFNIRSSYSQAKKPEFIEQINWNYRYNGLDLFGTSYYQKKEGYAKSSLTQCVNVDTLWTQSNFQYHKYKNQSFNNMIGLNYTINDNNSVGFKYTLKFRPNSNGNTMFNTEIFANGMEYDFLKNQSFSKTKYSPSHLANFYYHGKIGKWDIDFNADYLFDKDKSESVQYENSTNTNDRIVTSFNTTRNELFAGKLILSYPLFLGNFSIGTEYSNTKRNDDYINPEGYVDTSLSKLNEIHINPFVEYKRKTVLGNLSIGLRYEYVDFNYYESNQYISEQSRNFGNFFPNISLANSINEFQYSLSYSARTRRPTYQQLSNNVIYANRFTYQSGNPLLKHETIHNIGFMGICKFMQLTLDYNDRRNAIIYSGRQLEQNPAITLISFQNFHSLKSVSAFLSFAPKLGIWNPQLGLGIDKQWMELNTAYKTITMNKPMYLFSFNNTFNFGKGWIGSVVTIFQTKGDWENCSETRNLFYTNASLSKSFMDDKMSLKLSGNDLFQGKKTGNRLHFDQTTTHQIMEYNSQKITLTIRYNFNYTKSKYKGTGAANNEIQRL